MSSPVPDHSLRKVVPTMLGLIGIGLSLNCAYAQKQRTLESSFENSPEGWYVYDYNGGIAGGGNVFYPVTWEKTGGVANSGHIWADDSRWRIDTPERPPLIFPFVLYRPWAERNLPRGDLGFKSPGGEKLDLRNAEVSVYLKGDGLDLKGAKCFFWAFNGTRFIYTGHPLQIQQGSWGPKQTFTLRIEDSLWHRSWSATPENPANLDQVLKRSFSYGFIFMGFSNEVSGKISMDQLEIKLDSEHAGASISQPKAAAGGEIQFSVHLISNDYTYAFGICAADLDGDGDLDVAGSGWILGNHLACLRTSKVARLQFRTKEQIDAMKSARPR